MEQLPQRLTHYSEVAVVAPLTASIMVAVVAWVYLDKVPMEHRVQILQVDTIMATAAVAEHVATDLLVDILVVEVLDPAQVAVVAH